MRYKNVDIVKALDRIRVENLYVHDESFASLNFITEGLSKRKVYVVETLVVLNALVEHGTMLLDGGHGGGKTSLVKYLGQIFLQLSNDEIENCILRGHPDLTEEKILGSLDIAQLIGKKPLNDKNTIDVIWNSFVNSRWKIIDEINRISPYAQNILLSLLAESSVKYHNESLRLSRFSVYATMNPKDPGNFDLSLPFLDRFALALPITMPNYINISTIGKYDKSNKIANLVNYLEDFSLDEIIEEVVTIPYTEDAEMFINYILASYKLCDRISKEANNTSTVEDTLCTGCHYNVEQLDLKIGKVCKDIVNPLSVRVKEDLYRYGRALAWFIGDSEVKIEHVKTLAPYMIWHRSKLNKRFLQSFRISRFTDYSHTVKIELEATSHIIDRIFTEFNFIVNELRSFEKIRKGKLTPIQFEEYLEQISGDNYNFLIFKQEINKTLIDEYEPVYSEIESICKEIEETNTFESLKAIKDQLYCRYDLPNRDYLSERIEIKRNIIGGEKFTKSYTYNIPLSESLYETISNKCPDLAKLFFRKYKNLNDLKLYALELLADFGEFNYKLQVKKISTPNMTYNLKFIYTGDHDSKILKFLDEHKIV